MRSSPQTGTIQFTTKGRIVIPARIRRGLQIEGGTKAAVTITSKGILLRPVTRSSIKSLRGSLKGHGVMKSLMADRQAERAV